ncbi:MAG: hypothetical protein J6V53_03955 [Alphaproteobacteria bacterium]|nr:hypothetical protein [Alphaproteobacteria bacterium]
MFKIKSFALTLIILGLLNTPAQAGITTSLLLAPYATAQAVVQQISATVAGYIAMFQNAEIFNYGKPGIIRKEVTTTDNLPILTGEDVSFYTDETFTQSFLTELKKASEIKKGNDKGYNVSKLHQIVKATYLVDYNVQNSLNEKDKIDLDSDEVIKIDPLEDAKRANTQEFIQHKRYLSLHNGLAISEKILALMPKQEEEIKRMIANIQARREVRSLENGLSWLDKKIGIILNEMLVIESSILEINSTLMMQNKLRDIVVDD